MIDLDDLIAKARFYESAGHVAAYSESALELLNLLADALEAATRERDDALARIAEAAKLHRKYTYYDLEDSCPDTSEEHREEHHHEASDDIGEFYCEDMPTGDVVCDLCRDADGERMDWPCPTIQALDGAPEPEVEELPETGLEMRDSDGDLIMSGEHRKVLHQGMYVCDSCVNDLGLNVRWDRAGFMEGHPFPVEGEKP